MLEDYLLKLFLAALVGGAIGLEREYRDKSAGFRTMILISVGSCLFTLISDAMADSISDNTRVAAAVVTGIGFLGAGVILKDGTNIRGLTTAASIWMVSALGTAVGVGMYELSAVVTLAILTVLWFLPSFERYVDELHEFVTFHITTKNSDLQEEKVMELFRCDGVDVVHISRSQEEASERILHIKVKTTVPKLYSLSRSLANDKSVIKFYES
jgi:putative Mg2+ transporter-C (MgtC) family protein